MKVKDDVRIPDVEVLIQAASSDVGLFCFYISDDPHADMEIVAHVTDWTSRGALLAILKMAIQGLQQSGWVTLDELDTRTDEEKERRPLD
uniref:Uncharacterized protein n=1 Tax=uncultured prokaryote TaxID=198431 RepID=A0A0H5QPU3_9ZZZZ|nr:hypothetical protein [uncultured prokaryote]